MSYRQVHQTEINDKAMAIKMLKAGKYTYQEQGANLRVTSGKYVNVTINTTTGEVSGDSDDGHTVAKLGLLRQDYAETKCRDMWTKQGDISVESRTEERNGDIVLMICQA